MAGEVTVIFQPAWPEGGVFHPEDDPPEFYDPLAADPRDREKWVADTILDHAQRVRHDDPAALLNFVNEWGRLGVGIPNASTFPADSVRLTGEWLDRLSTWQRALAALQARRKAELGWPDFAKIFDDALQRVTPSAHPLEHGLQAFYRVGNLLDALILRLWDRVTRGLHFHPCKGCSTVFDRDRPNKLYCSLECGNRDSTRRAKREQRKKLKARRQRRGKASSRAGYRNKREMRKRRHGPTRRTRR